MIIELKTKAVCQIDIEDADAFRLLCKTLYMDFVLDEDTDFFIKENEDGENAVYVMKDGKEECVDDRVDLFVALRNVAVCMFPNVLFRSASYIYGN